MAKRKQTTKTKQKPPAPPAVESNTPPSPPDPEETPTAEVKRQEQEPGPNYVPLTPEQVEDLRRTFAAKRNVKPHLRCPACYNGRGGVAARRKWQHQINGIKLKRCYVCDTCGCEWVAEVKATEEDGIKTETTKVVEVRQHVAP